LATEYPLPARLIPFQFDHLPLMTEPIPAHAPCTTCALQHLPFNPSPRLHPTTSLSSHHLPFNPSSHVPCAALPPPSRDPELAGALRSLLHAVGAEMGLHPAQRI
ncbi:unnamed protein product, partial [Closterium sp. Naga37s-1]